MDHGEQDGSAWVATELIEGRPLRDQLVETHPSTGERAPPTLSMEDSAGPVAYAFEDRVRWERGALLAGAGGVPQALHPARLPARRGAGARRFSSPRTRDRAGGQLDRVVDFGLFCLFGAEGRDVLQVQQWVMGTAGYLSPEQRSLKVLDARSDLYAVGWHAVRGHHRPLSVRPRGGPGSRPPPPSELADIPAELDALVLSLLEWEPRCRLGYATDSSGRRSSRLGSPPIPTEAPLARISLVRPPLVGREAELGLATDAPAVIVVGEPGSGKTRLLAQLGEALDRKAIGADSRAEGGVVPALLRALAAGCPDEEKAEDWSR